MFSAQIGPLLILTFLYEIAAMQFFPAACTQFSFSPAVTLRTFIDDNVNAATAFAWRNADLPPLVRMLLS